MAAEDAAKCVACGVLFRARDAGFLGCYIHPLTINTETGHFRCCGLAPHDSPCATHAECSRDGASGCHRVDHCATVEERQRILTERPYVIGPLEQALSGMPYAKKADGVRVFHVTSEDQLGNKNFTIQVPKMWQGPGRMMGGRMRVDLRGEHKILHAALVEREYEAVYASTEDIDIANDLSDPYASEWVRYATGVEDVTTPPFVPFVIVVRIDYEYDGCSRSSRTACVWKD